MSELEPTRTYSNPTATVKLLPCPFCGGKVVEPTTNAVDAEVSYG